MTLTRFEPWNYLDQLHRDLDRFVSGRRSADDGQSLADWSPAVDIIEEKDRFVLRADVPGVTPADIDVSMDNGILSLSGERHPVAGTADSGFQRIERATGRFLRRFTLPDTADAEAISARCAEGILEVVIPKVPEVQARRISVEAA